MLMMVWPERGVMAMPFMRFAKIKSNRALALSIRITLQLGEHGKILLGVKFRPPHRHHVQHVCVLLQHAARDTANYEQKSRVRMRVHDAGCMVH